jgi:uncharacterized protein with ATP-grasp and redox domains
MNEHLPSLPLPPPLRGAETGSFAYDTIVRRLPEIGRRVLLENNLAPDQFRAIEALLAEIPHAPPALPAEPGASDHALWQAYLAPYAGQSWLDVPWFVAEICFYRRIVAATGYFHNGQDPFALQKRRGLEAVEPRSAKNEGSGSLSVAEAIHGALWGNQADLSLWPAGEGTSPGGAYLLADDTDAAVAHIEQIAARRERADIILDNAGAELVADLRLADALLQRGMDVWLHAKMHPTFVSDATEVDVQATVAWMVAQSAAGLGRLGARLDAAFASGQLALTSDWYWNSPLAGWELPGALRGELVESGLLISKGDANYRRWLGDRHWPFETPLDQILSYLPAPLLLLRTCKSNVAAGLNQQRMAEAAVQDQEWVTGGRWGVIQYVRR